MVFNCTLCGLGPRMTIFIVGVITLAFSLTMVGLAVTGIVAYNCDIDMTESKEAYGLFLFYFRSADCGPINLRYLGINVPTGINLDVPDMTAAVERTFIFALTSAILHGILAITTVLVFGTICISCIGRGCIAFSFYPWILSLFLVLALDVTGFVFYFIDFINAMDVEGVIDLLEIRNGTLVQGFLEQVDSLYFVLPPLFMWLVLSKAVIFWLMFSIFLFIMIGVATKLWDQNKPAPRYSNSMQPRQVMEPTSPPMAEVDREVPQAVGNVESRYLDPAPVQQQQQLPSYVSLQQPMQHPPPHLLAGAHVRRTVEPLNDEQSYNPPQDLNGNVPLRVNQSVDPFTDKRFSYMPGQPVPFSYLAGPLPGSSPRNSANAPPAPSEVRNQLPWSYFRSSDELNPTPKRVTATLTEDKEFAGREIPLPIIKPSMLADDRSSVTTDEGKWSGPEYKY